MTATDDLLDAIFDGRDAALYPEFEGWLRDSRRFRAFAETYRGKIRAKLRNARDESGLKDVRAELETAALLLRDERFTLEYEKYAALKQRGPDFTVTFRTHTPFNVEVRRVRGAEMDTADGEDGDARLVKLTAVLVDKVGQMPPSIVNLLWLVAEREIPAGDVNEAVAALRKLAESGPAEFFTRRGFDNGGDFLRRCRRLSGVMARYGGRSEVWLNPVARHKTPPEIVAAIRRLDG